MGRVFEGKLIASGLRFAIVVSRFNHFITDRLLEGAMDTLLRHEADEAAIDVVRTPGAWEIPLALRDLARLGGFDALVALGAVIRGGTPHFEYVSNEVSKGVFQVSMETDVPIGFGVLTCDSLEQALERSGAKAGNKGFEAATAAVEVVDLRARLRAGTGNPPAAR